MKSLVAVLALSLGASGQVHQHAPPADEARVDLAKLPAPEWISGVGHSHFEITTKSTEAQKWFDQGLALMHCFWDYEALRAFEQAARMDSGCAMCHWGIAQAVGFRGGAEYQVKEELTKAKDLSDKASDREKRIIDAYYGDATKSDKKEDRQTKALAALVDRYPNDVEIRLMLSSNVADRGYDKHEALPGTIYEEALLRDLLAEHPDNAAANHYWIHAVEGSDHPQRALDSANKLASLAPGSGHMVHMPGHIFYRMGDYERARQQFLAAKRVDEDYMAREHVAVRDDWNYAHNLSYLIADCAEEGRYTEALEHARSLAGVADNPDGTSNPGFYVFQIASSEVRLAIRFGDWQHVIDHPMQFGLSDDKLNVWARGYRDGLIAYARGMKAVDESQIDAAEDASNRLDALLWRLSKEKLQDKEKGRRDRVLDILGTASLELRGSIASQKGDLKSAVDLLNRADEAETDLGYAEPPMYARPPLEVLGAAYVRAGKFEDARAAYQKALQKRPKSGFALYGIAVSWDREADRKRATDAYRDFLQAWSNADPDLPEMKAARAYVGTAEHVEALGIRLGAEHEPEAHPSTTAIAARKAD